MKKKERNRPNVYGAIRFRIVALALALWLICMVLITLTAAGDMYAQIVFQAQQDIHTIYAADDIPGNEENRMLRRIHDKYNIHLHNAFPFMMKQHPDSYGSDDWYWNKMELLYGYEKVVIFHDNAGNNLMQTGDYLFFDYASTPYNSDGERPKTEGYGYIDLSDTSQEIQQLRDFVYKQLSGGIYAQLPFYDFYMTGWFEGGRFHPVTVLYHYLDIKSEYIFSGTAEPGKEIVSIYMENPTVCTRSTTPVSVKGTRFDNLTELLDAHISQQGNYLSSNLFNAVVIVASYTENQRVYAAYRFCPMGYAALRLIPFYAVTLALILVVLKLILRRIRQNLAEPLNNIITAVAFHAPLTPSAKWEEVYSLERQYAKFQQTLAEVNTELQQIRTKLDFAHNAEENRRQLISGLTHELKTPLAVIHSYAEGLQEGIAKEKEDQYLSVILEQSEKMDGLVLQMLDFSRLEAGKVRLSTDNFSLLKLAQSITDRFQPLLEDKELKLQYGICQDFLITADEARIEQVITNLVSNALKYTEPGNTITVSVYQHDGKAGFSIENPGTWLTDEQLDKVWDSFFRADPSRSTPGTGLGLAVVKQIIQLHQGSCRARNMLYKKQEDTYTGVQFSFQIPLG